MNVKPNDFLLTVSVQMRKFHYQQERYESDFTKTIYFDFIVKII